jgi:hypothetical protein
MSFNRCLWLVPLVLLAGCDTASETPPSRVLEPLAVGNRWSYVVFSGSGAIYDTIHVEITGTIPVTFGGRKMRAYVRAQRFGAGPLSEIRWLYTVGAEGIRSLGGIAPTDTLLLSHLERPNPESVGQAWRVPNLEFDGDRREFRVADSLDLRVLSLNGYVNTPSGMHQGVVYQYSIDLGYDVLEDWIMTEYYTPGIGLVALVIHGEMDNRLLRRILLYKYNLR